MRLKQNHSEPPKVYQIQRYDHQNTKGQLPQTAVTRYEEMGVEQNGS